MRATAQVASGEIQAHGMLDGAPLNLDAGASSGARQRISLRASSRLEKCARGRRYDGRCRADTEPRGAALHVAHSMIRRLLGVNLTVGSKGASVRTRAGQRRRI